MFEVGRWLLERRQALDVGEAAWLEGLADFARSGDWGGEGFRTCADWLILRCRMARSTAFEKLKVALELRRRPLVAQAFKAGRLSYSAVRLLMTLDRPDPDTDQALVELAAEGTLRDLQRAVRYYLLLGSQEKEPRERSKLFGGRGVRIRRTSSDDVGVVQAVLDEVELSEFERALQIFVDRSPVDESAAADSPVDQSAAADSPVDQSAAADRDGSWYERRADAFMAMVRTALAHAQEGHAAGADRYMVHVVVDADGRCELVDGTPIWRRQFERIACDSSSVAHLFRSSEPLAIGRRAREWSTAQRRSISVRDGGRCRFPGCTARICDIHHLLPWEAGGATDVDNGALHCSYHHGRLHKGWRVSGRASGELTYFTPYGNVIGTSTPPVPGPRLLSTAA